MNTAFNVLTTFESRFEQGWASKDFVTILLEPIVESNQEEASPSTEICKPSYELVRIFLSEYHWQANQHYRSLIVLQTT